MLAWVAQIELKTTLGPCAWGCPDAAALPSTDGSQALTEARPQGIPVWWARLLLYSDIITLNLCPGCRAAEISLELNIE